MRTVDFVYWEWEEEVNVLTIEQIGLCKSEFLKDLITCIILK